MTEGSTEMHGKAIAGMLERLYVRDAFDQRYSNYFSNRVGKFLLTYHNELIDEVSAIQR